MYYHATVVKFKSLTVYSNIVIGTV